MPCTQKRAKFGLSHNQLVALDVETRTRRRPGVGIVHRRRARQHNERPQLGKVLTPIVKIRKAIPPQESFGGAIPFAPHGAAKSRPQLGIVLTILMATNAPAPLVGNGTGQIPLGRIAFDRVMAADEIERADKTAFTAAIAKAAFYPTLAITEELQQQVQDFDGFCGFARMHDTGAPSEGEAPNVSPPGRATVHQLRRANRPAPATEIRKARGVSSARVSDR